MRKDRGLTQTKGLSTLSLAHPFRDCNRALPDRNLRISDPKANRGENDRSREFPPTRRELQRPILIKHWSLVRYGAIKIRAREREVSRTREVTSASLRRCRYFRRATSRLLQLSRRREGTNASIVSLSLSNDREMPLERITRLAVTSETRRRYASCNTRRNSKMNAVERAGALITREHCVQRIWHFARPKRLKTGGEKP